MTMPPLHHQFAYAWTLLIWGLMVIAVLHVFYGKRSPTSMIAWVLSIVFMPHLVVPLYLLIGVRKRDLKNSKAIPLGTSNNRVELITDGTVAYNRILQEIDNAKESIDMSTYVFRFDAMSNTLIDALTQKAKNGVKVRLLLDLIGSLGAYAHSWKFKALRAAGGEVVFFTSIFKRPLQNYINLRNHRKIYLFDRTSLLSGGMNLSNEYMGAEDGTSRWDDLLYALQGSSVYYFYQVFHNDWVYATKDDTEILPQMPSKAVGNCVVQVVPSGPDIPKDALYEILLNAIYNASQRIWIVTPYFVPDENITRALVIAYHKGVDVKLITPRRSNHFWADVGRSPYMRELEDAGADVVLYEGEMLHGKAILFDDIGSMVGSMNIDNRSLFLNYEIVAFINSPAFTQSIEQWMRQLIDQSSRQLEKPSKLRVALENIFKIFAPML